MLRNCAVFVGVLALGYWINNEKWKLVRAYERALRAHLRRIPSNQDVRINDIERKKFTIIQHRCGVTLMRAGHTELGLSQLAMAVLAADNPTFLLAHYQRQLSNQLYQQLSARCRMLERTFEFKRVPRCWGRTAVSTATVGTQCTPSQSEASGASRSRRAHSEELAALCPTPAQLHAITPRSAQNSRRDGSTTFGRALDASIASFRRKRPTEWDSISYCPRYFTQTSTHATKSTSSDDDYASSEMSEAITASSHITVSSHTADSGDWMPSSLSSECFDDTTTVVTKGRHTDGLAPEISFPSSEPADLEDWFSSSSSSRRLYEDRSLVPARFRNYCLRLLGVREDVLVAPQAYDTRTVNDTMRRYCVSLLNSVRRALLLYLYCNVSR